MSEAAEAVRPPGSRLLYILDRVASRPAVAWAILGADLVWLLFSILVGFSTHWETVFETVVAALTLAMVFVIQHTQARHQVATQRKLDEILRAVPRADNSLIALEDATDQTLATTRSTHRDLRRTALDNDNPEQR